MINLGTYRFSNGKGEVFEAVVEVDPKAIAYSLVDRARAKGVATALDRGVVVRVTTVKD